MSTARGRLAALTVNCRSVDGHSIFAGEATAVVAAKLETCVTDAIVWTGPERAAFVAAAAEAGGLTVVGAGGPGRTGATSAQRLGVDSVTDLRAAIAESATGVVLIADAGPFGTVESPGDAEAVLAAKARGTEVLTLDPVPASIYGLADGGWARSKHGRRAVDAVRFLPGARDHAMLGSLDEVLESFGEVRIASVRALGRREHGGLGAAMLGGLAMLRRVLGPVETIDAAIVGREAGERSSAGEDRLRDLHGHATAMARAERGAVGRMFASDAVDGWDRSIELVGPAGRLIVREDGFVWSGPDGVEVDSGTRKVDGDPAIVALGGAIRAHLAQPGPAGEELVEALAVAQAALLSARTREPESPASMMRAVTI